MKLFINRLAVILSVLTLFVSACAGPLSPSSATTGSSSMEMGGMMPADALAPQETEAGLFRITATSQLDPVAINELHSWIIHVERVDGAPVEDASITIDGGMPAHNHGFPTAPEITENLGGGDYLLEGVRFNMGGEWVIDITVEAAGETDTTQFVFTLQ
jgi:hypothetical protein